MTECRWASIAPSGARSAERRLEGCELHRGGLAGAAAKPDGHGAVSPPRAALLIARRDADAHALQTAGALRERSAKRYALLEFKALALSRGWISAVELRHSKPTGIFTAQGYRRPLHPNESGLRISLGRNRPGRLRARIDFAVAAREHDVGFCDGTIRESQPERFGLYPQWGTRLSRF